MEMSAKTAINVNNVFYEIAKKLLQGQHVQNPQGGMVLNQRPPERTVRKDFFSQKVNNATYEEIPQVSARRLVM
uniref:Uncharacterized protein n=1 Tax=Arundo donax TaxID=35708 RepID=A0A0A9E3J9_ARUDO